MDTTDYIWKNGEFIPWNDAKTHVMTHALHYGTGIFEGIRSYKLEGGEFGTIGATGIFRLYDHLERFLFSAKAFALEFPWGKEELAQIIMDLVKKNGVQECYLRPFAYSDYERLGPSPLGSPVSVVIAAVPFHQYLGMEPIKVKTSRFRRLPGNTTVMGAKLNGAYFNSALAGIEARQAGFDEALTLDQDGNVAEGSVENVFFVKDGILITPAEGSLLPGLTRDSLIELARYEKIPCEVRIVKPEEITQMDEAFFTGTGVEVHPIAVIDDHKFGDGKVGTVTKKMADLYRKATRGGHPLSKNWIYET